MRRSALIVAMTLSSLLALTALAGCSREKIDWKSAEAADTIEGYDHFIERHPESALVTQAHTRVAQLNEDRDWKKATGADTADGYRQFLAQHESGKWAEEARIRVENFSLDGTASGPGRPTDGSAAVAAASAATPAVTPAHGAKEAQPSQGATITASPPDAAPAKPAVAAMKPAVAAESKSASKPATAAEAKSAAKTASATKTAPAETHVAAATTPASTAKAALASAPAASPSQFGIQLGAFHSQDAALKDWKQLQAKYDSDLHGLFAHAVPVKQGSGSLFRLQAPVGEESRARGICASLAKHSQPCVVVLPQASP